MKDSISVVVGCIDPDGNPDFYAVNIICTPDQEHASAHRQAAEKLVRDMGGDPCFTIDEFDPAFLWISVLKINDLAGTKPYDIRTKEPA